MRNIRRGDMAYLDGWEDPGRVRRILRKRAGQMVEVAQDPPAASELKGPGVNPLGYPRGPGPVRWVPVGSFSWNAALRVWKESWRQLELFPGSTA